MLSLVVIMGKESQGDYRVTYTCTTALEAILQTTLEWKGEGLKIFLY